MKFVISFVGQYLDDENNHIFRRTLIIKGELLRWAKKRLSCKW